MKLAIWGFMLVCNLILPAVMIGFGWRFQKNPPHEINAAFGYRTNRSMKSQDAWDFAQEYMGRLWWEIGWIIAILAITVELLILLAPSMEKLIWWSFGITLLEIPAMIIATFLPVERALKRNFDKNGKRR